MGKGLVEIQAYTAEPRTFLFGTGHWDAEATAIEVCKALGLKHVRTMRSIGIDVAKGAPYGCRRLRVQVLLEKAMEEGILECSMAFSKDAMPSESPLPNFVVVYDIVLFVGCDQLPDLDGFKIRRIFVEDDTFVGCSDRLEEVVDGMLSQYGLKCTRVVRDIALDRPVFLALPTDGGLLLVILDPAFGDGRTVLVSNGVVLIPSEGGLE